MSTEFLSDGIWPEITRAVKNSKQRVVASVAFLGTGGSKQLPLKSGSVLVVNAAENTVKSGATNPRELLSLQKRGVRIYSVENLHAKVFVLGKRAYIGSNNVSNRSAEHWVESAVRTTEPRAVQAARKFVEQLCFNELGPGQLRNLMKIYRPPQVNGTAKRTSRQASAASGPRVFVVQLVRGPRDEEEQALYEIGAPVARKTRKHPRTWISDEFPLRGACRLQVGDKIVQVVKEDDGRRMVEEAATVLHVEPGRFGRELKTMVFVERPASNRRALAAAAKFFGCTQKQLLVDGRITKKASARMLLKSW